MDEVTAEQSRQNRTTERQWQMYAPHRQRIERLIVPSHPNGKLCVLGAGNCNDLDLRWLTDVYAEIHLVDLDAAAVKVGIDRQSVTASPKIHVHAPVDLTNIAGQVAAWSRAKPSAEMIEQGIQRVLEPPATPWGQCDVVLSPCVLTQTITPSRDALRDLPAPTSTAAKRLRAALRARHLQIFSTTLPPTGRGVLVIDLVSSEKIPDLPRIPAQEVPAAMDRFIAAQKNFRGLDPASLSHAAKAAGLTAQPTAPWLWHLGLHKSFLVYALLLTRDMGVPPMRATLQ